MQNQLLWYTRRASDGSGIKGPFPSGLVSRYILLGRVLLTDEVSVDSETWRPVQEIPELIPRVMLGDASDPVILERLNAAKRWADERLARDRRAGQPPGGELHGRRAGDRRQAELAEVVQHRVAKTKRLIEMKESPVARGRGMIMALGIGGVLMLAFVFMPHQEIQNPVRDCLSSAHPKAEWNGCKMEGAQLDRANLQGAHLRETILNGASLQEASMKNADLSYAELNFSNLRLPDVSGAILLGASLRGANLTSANLRGANLSYANFAGADVSSANLQGATLGNAIWIDESRCAPQSIGRCIAVTPR